MVRLSVNINDQVAEIIRRQKDQRGISTTECVRRAFATLRWVLSVEESGGKLLQQNSDGMVRQVQFLW